MSLTSATKTWLNLYMGQSEGFFFMIMNYYDYEMELMYMVVKKSQNPKIGGMFTLDS